VKLSPSLLDTNFLFCEQSKKTEPITPHDPTF
jgi:hypothetical protein